jgi:hypothetical protein
LRILASIAPISADDAFDDADPDKFAMTFTPSAQDCANLWYDARVVPATPNQVVPGRCPAQNIICAARLHEKLS